MRTTTHTNSNYGQLRDAMYGVDYSNIEGEVKAPIKKPLDDFSEAVKDIDFSEAQGSFKKVFHKANKKIAKKKKFKPLTNEIDVKHKAFISGNKKQIAKIIVPSDRKTIVEGVSKFILSTNKADDALRNINYYKGEKLEHIVFTMDNTNSAVDFNLELFNPSMPLDYYQSTSQNLNDKITIAGGQVAYTDVLYNLLANPALMVNAKFVFNGASVSSQINQSLIVKNKNITGEQKIDPTNVSLMVDNMQYQNNIVTFNLQEQLNRPFIPDGMDVMQYKVLAGMQVVFAFFYKQHSLKKILFKEARNSKAVL